MDTTLTCILNTLADTEKFGRVLGKLAEPGDIILLEGDLGAGKTTLTQSIAIGIGVPPESYVTSPSFSLMNQHFGRIPLYHIDCYRLDGEDDVEGSGLMDYIVADGLTVVEWPDRLGSLKPDQRLEVCITLRNDSRALLVNAHGGKWKNRLQQLKKNCLDLLVPQGKDFE